MTEFRSRFQFSLQTLLVAIFAFALGFTARNLASGMHPFAMQMTLPSSKTPVTAGDALIVESLADSSISRRVTVLADGTISLPYVGTVSVSGQNPATIEQTLTKSYQNYFKNPAIQVYRAHASQPLR